MGVILLTLLSVCAVSADTIVMENYTFDIPDGYTIVENDTQLILYNDDYVIYMYQGPILNPSVAKQNRLNKGFTLIDEKNYSSDGAIINQQNYFDDCLNSYVYTLEKNNKTYIITLVFDGDEPISELEDNPVDGIIDSLT